MADWQTVTPVPSVTQQTTPESHQPRLDLHPTKNPFVSEICQIPRLCELDAVSQLRQKSESSHDVSSLTSCFQYIVDPQGHVEGLHESKSPNRLYKWAFEILKSGKTGRAWTKSNLSDEIGEDCFHYCQQKGILVDVNNCSYGLVAKIFYDWFTAHYVKYIGENRPKILDQTLQVIDPGSHSYVYRFASGISIICAQKILKYLKGAYWKMFRLLCMVEQEELQQNFMTEVKRICQMNIEIKDDDTAIMERSKLQLMEIASWKKVSPL